MAEWDSDEGWQRASRAEDGRYAHLYLPELWVPQAMPVIRTSAPWGQDLLIGSSLELLDALREVNERTYGVIYPSEGPFDDAARYGLAVLLGLAQQGVAQRLPLKLDY